MLKEQAEHHHAEEEKHLFPKVLKLIDAAQREALGMEMLALQHQEGPCLDVFSGHTSVQTSLAVTADRWPTRSFG